LREEHVVDAPGIRRGGLLIKTYRGNRMTLTSGSSTCPLSAAETCRPLNGEGNLVVDKNLGLAGAAAPVQRGAIVELFLANFAWDQFELKRCVLEKNGGRDRD
jgi:hypothetical protein